MVDREVFDRRLAKLEELLRRLRSIADEDWQTFRSDPNLQAAAERWLHLAAECTLDLAHHLIADRGWRTPTTYREAFQVLRDEGVLAEEHCRQMQAWAGLRNVLVHVYLEVDLQIVHQVLQNDLDQLESFAASLSRAVRDDSRL